MALSFVIDQTVGDPDITQSPSRKRTVTGVIVFIHLSSFGWISLLTLRRMIVNGPKGNGLL